MTAMATMAAMASAITTSTSRIHYPLPLLSMTQSFSSTTTCSFISPFHSSSSLTSLTWKKARGRDIGYRNCSRLKISCAGLMEIKEDEFSEVVLKSDLPVLVEFVATWCGPCRLIGPAMESLAEVRLHFRSLLSCVVEIVFEYVLDRSLWRTQTAADSRFKGHE
ncbi:Thioredoxin X, chloroplastic [Capsicum annuum]|nr:Thioredoxin X, chloroplastic [Capsicum annuum]